MTSVRLVVCKRCGSVYIRKPRVYMCTACCNGGNGWNEELRLYDDGNILGEITGEVDSKND